MNKLSTVIITKNEENNIRDCLESVRWSDEIIVMDDFSGDRTAEIAKRYTDKIFLHKMEGFGQQKQFGIEKATGEWILVIDADERVTPELEAEIKEAINKPPPFNGYYIPMKNIFFGRWMKHGGLYPFSVLRLFRKKNARCDGAYVHEKVLVEGEVGRLENSLIHFGTRDITHYFKKFNTYTSLSALKLFRQGVRIRRYNIFLLFLVKPLYYFLKRYFWQKGLLDGRYGFLFALFTALTVFVYYLKLWEKQNVYKKGDK